MEQDCQMTRFYRRYKQKQIDENGLVVRIFNYVLGSRNEDYGLFFRNDDDRADFMCWLYPRLLSSIRNYRNSGSTFGAYIATTLRYSCREYNLQNDQTNLANSVYYNESAHESEVCEPEEVYESEESFKPGILTPAQILLVVLKSYYFVTDALIAKAAPVIGIDTDVLTDMIDALHKLRSQKEAKAEKLTVNIQRLYYRRLMHEKRMEIKSEDKTAYAAISMRVEQIRRRMDRMRKRLKAMRLEATNKEVAEVLGIPKGTVDSRVAVIKTRAISSRTK
jgi:hypothetical protein